MTELGAIVPNSNIESVEEETEAVTLRPTNADQRLLVDVLQHPYSGVVERYRRIGVSRRKGNSFKESCLAKELLKPVEIPTQSGRVVLLELTNPGKRSLRDAGYEVPDGSRWGSLEHEYWKHTIAEGLKRSGHEVLLEAPVNGYTDIIAKQGDRMIAIEIETGKSDWHANIQKNIKKEFSNIILAVTNEEALKTIQDFIEKEKLNQQSVQVMIAWEVITTLTQA